jgi:PHS family inorganic phosphate transporter-like MFS transporter
VDLNTSTILETIGYGSNEATVFEKYFPLLLLIIDNSLRNLGMGNIILSLAGLVPGYWFAVAFIDVLGRKRLQIGGFLALAVIFSVLGFGLHTISNTGLVVLVCMANFFCGFGPNSTTFVIPGEVFPTRYRSTGHGLSAAAGKTGVIISQVLIGPLANKGGPNVFLNHVMEIFAFCMYQASSVLTNL